MRTNFAQRSATTSVPLPAALLFALTVLFYQQIGRDGGDTLVSGVATEDIQQQGGGDDDGNANNEKKVGEEEPPLTTSRDADPDFDAGETPPKRLESSTQEEGNDNNGEKGEDNGETEGGGNGEETTPESIGVSKEIIK